MKNSTPIFLILFLILPGCQPGGETVEPPFRLGADVKTGIRDALATMESDVTLHFYHGGKGDSTSRKVRALIEFMEDVSPRIRTEDYSLDERPGAAGFRSSLGVDHGPVVRIEGAGKGNHLFYGFPERKELNPFLDGILTVSGQPAELPDGVENHIVNLDQDVEIRIFTSPD
jgi:alkyl hydroperoxide reductase subunit AhpF